MHVNLTTDYHPWTACFSDGTYMSRKDSPGLTYADVARRLPEVVTFTIHFGTHDVTFHADGRFDVGGATMYHPEHMAGETYALVYYRRCQGRLAEGKIKAEVTEYHLGYSCGKGRRLMCLSPSGAFRWGA